MKSKNFLIFIILILPYIEPLSFKDIEWIDNLYSILKVINFFVIFLIYYTNVKRNKYKLSKYMIIIVLYQLELYISTFINKGSYNELFGQTISVLSTVMLTEIYIRNKEGKMVLKALYGILFIYSIINISTLLKQQNTNAEIISFLGMDNRYIFFLLPMCVFSIIYSLLKYNKLNKFSYLLLIISAFQVFYTWSVGAMLAIIILMVFTLAINKLNKLQKISFKVYLILIIILNILLVFIQVQYYFENFIVNYLHKDLNLSGRVYTWDAAIEVIKQYPILGIGGQTGDVMQSIYYGTNQHAHNLFLNILVKGGVISLLIQFWMYLEIDKKLKKCQNKKISAIFAFSMFLILFISLADTFDTYLVYIIYTLAYYINDLHTENRKEIENE